MSEPHKLQKSSSFSALELYPEKYFKWDKIEGNATFASTLKKRGNTGRKNWNQRYFALYYNYLVYWKPGKGKDGKPTDKDAVAKGVIAMESIVDLFKIEQVEDKHAGFCFQIPTVDTTFYLLADSFELMTQWIKAIKQTVEALAKAERRGPYELMMKKLAQVQIVFPENAFRIPPGGGLDQAERWVQDMRRFKQEYKKWSPFVHSLTLFAEFQQGRTKGYVTWFTNKSRGPLQTIVDSEEESQNAWKKLIQGYPKEMEAAIETMFFAEDLAPTIKKCEKTIELVDIYNAYEKEFNLVDEPKLVEEKELLKSWLENLQSYPHSKDVDLKNTYAEGRITCVKEDWLWKDGVLKRSRSSQSETEEVVFQLVECQLVHPMYGIILWNTKSCVWTHPRCPFIIRYDWNGEHKYLKQHMFNGDNTHSTPSLPDWIESNGYFTEIDGPDKATPPQIMRALLGIVEVTEFVATGLDPIF